MGIALGASRSAGQVGRHLDRGVCPVCGGPFTASNACWGCWRRFEGPIDEEAIVVKRLPDTLGAPIFHDWGPRPDGEAAFVKEGQAWLYAFDGEQSTWVVKEVCETSLGPEATLERWYPHADPRATREVYARAMVEDTDWGFLRHAYDEAAKLALAREALSKVVEKPAAAAEGAKDPDGIDPGTKWVLKDPSKVGPFLPNSSDDYPIVVKSIVIYAGEPRVTYDYQDRSGYQKTRDEFLKYLRRVEEPDAAADAPKAEDPPLPQPNPDEWEPADPQPGDSPLPVGDHVVLINNPNFIHEGHPVGELVAVRVRGSDARCSKPDCDKGNYFIMQPGRHGTNWVHGGNVLMRRKEPVLPPGPEPASSADEEEEEGVEVTWKVGQVRRGDVMENLENADMVRFRVLNRCDCNEGMQWEVEVLEDSSVAVEGDVYCVTEAGTNSALLVDAPGDEDADEEDYED